MQTININTLNSPSKKTLQKKGLKNLLQGDFRRAFDLFQNAFWLDTNDLDTKIGLYLSDMGMDFGQEAIGIYEFYQSVLTCEPRANKHKIQKMILSFIDAFDERTHNLSEAMQNSKNAILESYNAINYADIKTMLKTKNFKEVYSGLPFNTKLVFNKKGDFYEFLTLLVKNDYVDILLNYIDALPKVDNELIPLIEAANHKLEEKNKIKKKEKSLS
ncbi:hypothetical protein CQA53_09010 [Helicobacter didelphidarum]|uniref:Histidine kinase n=1 Tax=Helicobacter didelphidarum TaxID=2040648 RepID=A0A3D8ICE3_9HELI|nr:hypothetical protein [Helicobacter didelphidarum]RDU62837.1 hypothetical protein CQA53_09010 [Helicobacter didelphidarum]